ncbi:hypothetical protein RFI_31578 [Reticulomyxa filosa]|uniref:Uncharacterized protein n=1 Tax=Reticulomyxa filosa TaxID=46433 RepID=X6LW21_RETFI|nr:hypothetical protein RFI_31578 [Reticulomyxa filosa]|eukprot:ETO05819.1 hypothetical protein RFI_31578 [Reticulomyxa filosa]
MIIYQETKSKDGRYSVIIRITKENVAYGADVRDWSACGVVYYNLPVFFENNSNAIASNNYWNININESLNVHVVFMDKKNAGDKVNGFVFIYRMNTRGCMQTKDTNNVSVDNDRYAKGIDLLMVFCSNVTDKNELMSKFEEFNSIVSSVISYLASKDRSINVKEIKDEETVAAKKEVNENQIEKEEKKAEVGQTKPGANLQGYCTNGDNSLFFINSRKKIKNNDNKKCEFFIAKKRYNSNKLFLSNSNEPLLIKIKGIQKCVLFLKTISQNEKNEFYCIDIDLYVIKDCKYDNEWEILFKETSVSNYKNQILQSSKETTVKK